VSEEDIRRELYAIMGECGMDRPPWEEWAVHARENAEVWPIEADGQMVGGILWKGHSVHIAVRPAYHCRWLKKSHLRAWRQFAHPVALFATPAADNTRAVELAERLGFVRRGRTGQSIILVKEATCPSP